MNTYLLTWNPKYFAWEDMETDINEIKANGFLDGTWSCGRTKRIEAEDRLFLLRQGLEPRGIVASGKAKSSPYEDMHWDESRDKKVLYVDIRFDSILLPEVDGVLPISQLQTSLGTVNWRTRSSGISIDPVSASKLEDLWSTLLLKECMQLAVITPEEISAPAMYFEGAAHKIFVNAYERDPRARKKCISYYGAICFVCDFDFAIQYGELGKNFIHVHHLVPLSEIGENYAVDPIQDLRPVCPNCHAMLHKNVKMMLTIENLKEIILKNRSTKCSS